MEHGAKGAQRLSLLNLRIARLRAARWQQLTEADLASELISGLQAHFSGSGICLSGGVLLENAASARVLEKAGFTPQPSAGEMVYSWCASG